MSTPPEEFITALESLKGQTFRPEFHLTQIPPPTQIAPYAVALQAELNPDQADPEHLLGSAKFVVLYDPEEQPAWNGPFRIVINAQAPMDGEIGDDPLLGEVAWSWLTDALAQENAPYHSLNGTVTRVFNETFGDLHLNTARVDLEVRASWSPTNEQLTTHLHAWANFAAAVSGLGPWSPNVVPMPRKVDLV